MCCHASITSRKLQIYEIAKMITRYVNITRYYDSYYYTTMQFIRNKSILQFLKSTILATYSLHRCVVQGNNIRLHISPRDISS